MNDSINENQKKKKNNKLIIIIRVIREYIRLITE